MQNLTEIKGNWTQSKAKLKSKFAMLTNSDLLLKEGKQEEMIDRLQSRLGKSKEEIYKLIAAL